MHSQSYDLEARAGGDAPAASVIIPCYNTAKYLRQAIDSVLAQTRKDFELIVVDDGSTDESAEIVRSFTDPRVKYCYQANSGLSAARNTGIRNSRGRYITVLDADDLFLPEKLEKQVSYLDANPDAGMVVGGFQRISESATPYLTRRFQNGRILPETILIANQFSPNAWMMRREWVDRVGYFDETMKAAEDWDYYCRLVIAGCEVHCTSDVVCVYRLVPGSMSSNGERQTNFMLQVVDRSFADPQLDPGLKPLRAEATARTHLKGAMRLYISGDTQPAAHHLSMAMQTWPQLAEDEYFAVMRLMNAMLIHNQVPDIAGSLDRLFSNLPGDVTGLRSHERKFRRFVIFRAGAIEFRNAIVSCRWQAAAALIGGFARTQPWLIFWDSRRVLGRRLRRLRRQT